MINLKILDIKQIEQDWLWVLILNTLMMLDLDWGQVIISKKLKQTHPHPQG